jgi:hypothetical protein
MCVLALRLRSWRIAMQGTLTGPPEAEDQDATIGRIRVVSMQRSELSAD